MTRKEEWGNNMTIEEHLENIESELERMKRRSR